MPLSLRAALVSLVECARWCGLGLAVNLKKLSSHRRGTSPSRRHGRIFLIHHSQIFCVVAAVQIPIDLVLYGSRSGWVALPWLVLVGFIVTLHSFPSLLCSSEPVPRIPAAAAVLLTFILASHAAAGVEIGVGGAGARVVSGLHLMRVLMSTSAAVFASQVRLAATM